MINVNQIAAQLSRMPDSALQQYANMHKADPYILSLAVSESNRRKQMRTAAQGQGAMPQPKVADAEIAGMAMPEEVGIGQLPAENIQGMAGGGIVAFADGGGYGFGNTAQPRQYTQAELAEAKRLREMGLFDLLREKFGPAWESLTTGPQPQVREQTFQTGVDIGGPGSSPANMGAARVAPTVTFGDDKGGAGADKLPPLPPTQPATPQLASGLPGFLKAAEKFAPEKAESQESFLARQKAAIGDSPLAAQTERLEKREKAASGEKEDAFNMALIKAGLGMMAGKSQYALQNIGEGGAAGLADYNEAIKDLKKASLEREKMRNDLENAQYAYKRGDFDAYEKSREKAGDRQASYRNQLVSGIAAITGSETSARAHLAAAGMPGAQERLIGRIGSDPRFAAAYEKYASTNAEAKGLPALAAKIAATPGGMMALKAENPVLYQAINDYLMGLTGAGGVPSPMNNPTGAARP
jgi:hypothetical protein